MVYDGKLIAGGDFTVAGGVAANHIAQWDGESWQPLGEGRPTGVDALAVYDGKLIADGQLSSQPSGHLISQWDGATWTQLGGPFNKEIFALANHRGALVAGGQFTTAGGAPANLVAQWDPESAAWLPLGAGIAGSTSASVLTLAVHEGILIAGGNFSIATSPAKFLSWWNGSAWQPFGDVVKQPLGSNVNGTVRAVISFNNELIAGGHFTIAGTEVSAYWARWAHVCPLGDFNQDGAVGPADLAQLLADWGQCPPAPQTCPADLNHDGAVGPADLAELLSSWG
jgi:hypothetical protein